MAIVNKLRQKYYLCLLFKLSRVLIRAFSMYIYRERTFSRSHNARNKHFVLVLLILRTLLSTMMYVHMLLGVFIVGRSLALFNVS